RAGCPRTSSCSWSAATSTSGPRPSSTTWISAVRCIRRPRRTVTSAETTSTCPGNAQTAQTRYAKPREALGSEASCRIRVYDSLRRQVVPLPLSIDPDRAGGGLLRLYVCGVTPYDSGHMGHAFTFGAFDHLVRWAEASGIRVRYVQNVTDVDDPLFERARRVGVRWDELSGEQLESFVADMTALGWRPPDVMPLGSKEIPVILAAVDRLVDAGFAYQTEDVYFDVSRYPGYGDLSHATRRSMLRKLRDEGLLGEVGPGAKRDALDFQLWRRSEPDEPAW